MVIKTDQLGWMQLCASNQPQPECIHVAPQHLASASVASQQEGELRTAADLTGQLHVAAALVDAVQEAGARSAVRAARGLRGTGNGEGWGWGQGS